MKYDVIVIGGGPAGLAAAIESSKNGANTVLIEREPTLGGILNQCIHNGFGLHYFGEELTGPEYAKRFVKELEKTNVKVLTSTFVTEIHKKENFVRVVNQDGCEDIEYKALVLSMGCREKTAGQINLKGTRPAGIYTAGQLQKMVNYYGKLPGKEVVILGSGDIGLIMARRLTFEGSHVKMVVEIMPQSGGLKRNIVQCLNDFDIPLMLSTTVKRVVGENKVEGVYISGVDDKLQPIGKETFVPCDTLVLSVGLIPEIELAGNVKLNNITGSYDVNEYRQTSQKNIFACGNVLHVHDLVDNVTLESKIAGKSASLYSQGKLKFDEPFNIFSGEGIKYVIPSTGFERNGNLTIMFRTTKRIEKKFIKVKNQDGSEVFSKFTPAVNAGEMQTFEIDKSKIKGNITVSVEERI